MARQGYDRVRLLSKAAEARRRGRRTKALELYEQVLVNEPHNTDLHLKVAPLYAETRRRREALESFARATRDLMDRGFDEKAIGVCRHAVGYFPQEPATWEALANLQLKRGRPADAVGSLLEGRTAQRGRRGRPSAVRLLRKVLAIEPEAFEPGLDLALQLARTGERREALSLLERMARRARGRRLRRVYGVRLRLAPGPRAAWHWLRAAVSGR